MSPAARLTVVGLGLAALVVVLGVAVIPTHATPGNGSIRCGTVFRPERESEIAPLCGPAGDHQLRATVILGAILVLLAIVPVLVEKIRPRHRTAFWAGWAVFMLGVAIAGVVGLGFFVEYSPDRVFIDL
jgi:hypothetical protein